MMNYGPLNPTAVPTLGGWMLILLSLLLMAVAFKMAKRKGSAAQKLFITLVGVSAIFAGSGGFKLVSEVNAAPAILLSNPSGGMVSIIGGIISDTTTGYNTYTNTSGVIQVIKTINLSGLSCNGFPHGNTATLTECATGLQLQPNGMCEIDCSQSGGYIPQ